MTLVVGTIALFVLGKKDLEIEKLAQFTYRTVEAILRQQSPPKLDRSLPSRGVFVTIESNGKILGCRGSVEATKPTLELEIQSAAKSATIFDPRYGRINLQNKPFAVTLTLVERLEPIGSIESLRPDEGLVLTSSKGTGVVLPFEGRDPKTRLEWAYKKASTPFGTPAKLQRLFAKRSRFPEK